MKTETLFSSASEEWETPQNVFDALDREFHFTLDPCSSDANYKCEKHYTKLDDGLKKDWGGSVFFVIHHMAGRSASGCRSAMKKA